jgi:hypothetical protein
MISIYRHLGWFIAVFVLDAWLGQAALADSDGACPAGAEVDAALAQLLSARSVRTPPATVAVDDLGARWSVQVAGRSATYSDPDRNCVERTRIAAVFAALVLEPPDMGEPPPAPLIPAAVDLARLTGIHRLDLAPEFLLAPGAGARRSAMTWGGSLRWLASGRRFGVTAGLQASYPAIVKVQAYELSLARIALDASATVSWRLGAVEFGLELGPYGALLLAHGRGLAPNGSSAHVDAGGRLGLRARLVGLRLSPFLAFQTELSARQFALMVDPIGNVGTAPRVWLGLLAGASLSLDGGR